MRGRLASRLTEPVIRRPGLVLLATLALTLAAAVPALRFRVDTDLAALLPDGAPGADDYRLFLNTFGGFEKVFVLVRSEEPLEDPGPLVEAAEVLAGEMSRSPEVAEARSGITEEDERFFLTHIAPRMPLLMEGDVRKELAPRLEPQAIRDRVALMRQTLRGPAGSALAPLFAADPLGLSEGLIGAASAALPVDPLTGAFLSRRGDAALVVLTPARAEIDPEGGRALLADLEKAYARARETVEVPLDIVAVGGPIYAAQDETILRADLTRTAAGSAAGVAALLLIGFGGGFIPLVILACVLAGLIWTAAITALWLGRITVVGVGFAAALIGMGVEYGIHGGARFRQLIHDGLSGADALRETFRDPGPGIVSSALTTAAGLGALALAHFRPLREVGQVLTVGVLVTLVTTVTLGAALLLVFPQGVRLRRQALLWRRWGYPALRGTVGFAASRPAVVLTVAALLTAVSVWGATRLDLSTDLRSLRPADHPSARAERLLVETFSVGLDTFSVVAQGKTTGEALDRAAAARRILEERLGPSAEITSPSDWLVEGERLRRRLGELQTLPLERAVADFERELAAAGFRVEPFAPALAALRSMGRGEDLGAPPPSEWPRWVRELIRPTPEGTAVAVHVRVPLGAAGPESAEALAQALEQASPGLALASIPRVGAELRGLAIGDLRRSSAVAFALVALVVIVSVGGRIGDALLSGLPLALGCLWGFGLWGAFGGHVDVLAISTLPVLFGTGIDLGVHAVHGGRLRPGEGIRGTVERSGLAMILIALTTGIGFGSLGSSRVPGLQNAGMLVAVGVTACLVATFLVLPALEALSRGRRMREDQGSHSGGST
ncbi:MAG TPA: MMPL family transporter [Thermoanaerobaculia bacterium]|nr:MMPL family transporter [Thermoanaerobaculia bacterium]